MNPIRLDDYRDGPLRPGGGGGDNGDMEARLTAVEGSIVRIDQNIARIDAMLPTLATKAELAELRSDMHKGFADQTKWIIGTGFAGIAVFITVMTFVLNNATPKATPPQAQAPIIINVPAAPAPQPAPAASR